MRNCHPAARFALFSLALCSCAPAVQQAGHTLEFEQPSNSANGPTAERLGTHAEEAPAQPAALPAGPELAPPAPVPPGGHTLGRPGGIAVEGMSESGHWAVTCQRADGREVDMPMGPRGAPAAPVQLELFLGEDAETIDALLAQDAVGRYLVVLRDAQAWLVDSVGGARWSLSPLSPDLRSDRLAEHRSFAFSDTHLVLISTSDRAPAFALPLPHVVAQKDQASSFSPSTSSQPIKLGSRTIYRVQAGPGHARFILLKPGSSEKSWPIPASEGPVFRCASPTLPFSAFGDLSRFRPDPEREIAWLPLQAPLPDEPHPALVPEAAPGFVMASGDSWVRRLDTGRVLLVRGGTARQLTSERCGARILHGYGPKETFLMACEEYEPVVKRRRGSRRGKPKYRFDLYLIRPGFVKSLNADVARTGVDVMGPSMERYVPVRPGATAALVDFIDQRLINLEGDARVVAVGHGRALIRRGNELSLFIGPGRPEENVDLDLDALDPVVTSGSVVAIGTEVIALQEQVKSWSLPRPPLALSESGHALLANEPSTLERWPRGPLVLIGPGSPETSLESPDQQRAP